MPTLAQLEEKFDCPAYGAWSNVPKYLKPRKWFAERGVKIPKDTKPEGVKGQFGSYIVYPLFNVHDYDLESFFVYEIWAYRTKKEVVHLFSGRNEKQVQTVLNVMRKRDVKSEFLLYEIREEKFYPVKKKR